MKKLLLSSVITISLTVTAQSNTALSFIEGSKSLVELVKTFKTPRTAMNASSVIQAKDSCAAKGISDFSVKNNTGKPMLVNLYRRTANGYDNNSFTLRVLPKNRVWLYELKCGIYKIKIETEEDGTEKIYTEEEIKLTPCQNPVHIIQAQ